jgi:molybdate transport system substrate-binding protein
MKKIMKTLFFLMLITMVLSCGAKNEEVKTTEQADAETTVVKEKETLLVYSGAGLKKPMDEIAKLFEEQENVTIEFNYAGSGQLLTQLETTGKGDVYIVGSVPNYEAAKNKDLVSDYITIAHHTPAIVTLKGNPKEITALEDLGKKDIKVILGDEKASAIGKTAQEILKKNNLENINENVVSKAVTVNEMVVQLTTGKADVMIATIDSVFGNNELEIIEIAPDKNIDQIIAGGIVVKSEKADLADKFIKFVASEKGKEIFEKYGFKPVAE